MADSYKQNISKAIENLNKLKARSLTKGKPVPQDICIAEVRLKDYLNVLTWLREKDYVVSKGGIVKSLTFHK